MRSPLVAKPREPPSVTASKRSDGGTSGLRKTSKGKASRHPLWSREAFLDDLKRVGVIKTVCETYAGEEPYKPYQTDVWRWRQEDPEFDLQVSTIIAANGAATGGGRKPLDEGDKSWREDYRDALVECDLALDRAAKVTPYSVRTLNEMIDPSSSQWDQELAALVSEAELIVSSRAREAMVAGIKPENYSTPDNAKITSTRAMTGLKVAEKLDRRRFGTKHLEVSGTVAHQHSHRYLPPNEKLAMLIEDRNRFMLARSESAKELPAHTEEEPIDAEVIDAESV